MKYWKIYYKDKENACVYRSETPPRMVECNIEEISRIEYRCMFQKAYVLRMREDLEHISAMDFETYFWLMLRVLNCFGKYW